MSSLLIDISLDWLLQEESCEDDNRRFYCSYLIGHVSLITNETSNNDEFIKLMEVKLEETLSEDHLSEIDKKGIKVLWQELCNLAITN